MANYSEAALRHYEDAEHLASKGRYDTAAHLLEFAAECAIKHSIEALRPQNRAPHLHFPELVEAAKRQIKGRSGHPLFTILQTNGFMSGWKIDHRYASSGTVSERQYETWRGQARRAIGAAQLRS